MKKILASDQTKLFFSFSLVLFLIGLINIGAKIFNISETSGWDFRVVWISGKIWLDQLNPYFLDTFELYNNFKPKGFEHLWVYPPNWSVISIPISYLPFSYSVILWNITSISLLSYALYLFMTSINSKMNKTLLISYLFQVLFLFYFSHAVGVNLFLGQTTTVVTAGILFYFQGIVANNSKTIILGALLLCLKPTLAIVIIPIYLLFKRDLKIISLIVLLVIGMSIPAFLLSGLLPTLKGFLDGLKEYVKFKVNTGADLTGLAHIIYITTNKNISGALLTFAGAFSTVIVLFLLFKSDPTKQDKTVCAAFYYTITMVLFFVPLHSYDWIVLLVLLALLPELNKFLVFCVCIAALLMIRSNNLENILGVNLTKNNTFSDTTLLTVVSIILICGLTLHLVINLKNNRL